MLEWVGILHTLLWNQEGFKSNIWDGKLWGLKAPAGMWTHKFAQRHGNICVFELRTVEKWASFYMVMSMRRGQGVKNSFERILSLSLLELE